MSEVHIVRAFTANGEHGNPAGVVVAADNLTDQAMLKQADSIGLSETAFVCDSDRATKKVRFFTPTVEEPLCGHATIATWSLLHQMGAITAGSYTQETKAGILAVEVQNTGLVFMEQAPAAFYDNIAPANIASMLALDTADLSSVLRPQIVSTGIKDLLVPVRDKVALSRIQPDLAAIARFSKQHDISGLHVFTLLGGGESLASARNFAPADGIPEECATGTSNGALLCLLKSRGLLPAQPTYRIEQGESMGQLSYVYGTFKGDVVWIGGYATSAST